MTIRLDRLAFVALPAILCLVFTASAQSIGREELEAQIDNLHDQLKHKEAQFLTASPIDAKRYSRFLAQPNTGLCRLMPRETFDGRLLTRGGGAYYSFTELTNEYGNSTQIGLERQAFASMFAGAAIGLMVSLGDVPLDTVDADQDGVRYLTEIVPPTREPEAREWQRRAGAGFAADGVSYKSTLPATVNGTYVVRSIQFNRADVLVAFRVVRQDADGSVTLLWKILKQFPTPQLLAEQAQAQ
jgi:hypothetical protein